MSLLTYTYGYPRVAFLYVEAAKFVVAMHGVSRAYDRN